MCIFYTVASESTVVLRFIILSRYNLKFQTECANNATQLGVMIFSKHYKDLWLIISMTIATGNLYIVFVYHTQLYYYIKCLLL